jgi:hypothetical protein
MSQIGEGRLPQIRKPMFHFEIAGRCFGHFNANLFFYKANDANLFVCLLKYLLCISQFFKQ